MSAQPTDRVPLGWDLAYTKHWWQINKPAERIVYANPYKHTACFGESRSGKSSIAGAWVQWVAPRIQAGTWQLYCLDLKGGVEANMIPPSLRAETATNATEAEELLDLLINLKDERTAMLVDMHERKLAPTVDTPGVLLYGDELNDLARQDNSKKLVAKMSHLLSTGSAEGLVVLGLAQEATKELFPFRTLFQQRIALRLEKGMALLALGEQAKPWGARPWLISPDFPGEGYLLDYERHRAKHFQAWEVTDDDLMALDTAEPPRA